MAKFSSYYTLCPLIDQQNLLGVEADSHPDCAIVTLGKNIVIRYKLQDRKQVSSWSTRERLTTHVIYDEISKSYVAAFNNKNIRIWQDEEKDLDSVKKLKFSLHIHTILTLKNTATILVMQNGATISLAMALENRKNLNAIRVLNENEKIVKCQLVQIKQQIFLCAITIIDQIHHFVSIPLKKDDFSGNLDQIVRVELKRASEKLIGYVVMSNNTDIFLLTLWSHGRLYRYSISSSTPSPAPGSLVSVIKIINTNHPVTIIALNESTIALYGADPQDEGAVLVIYNVQYKLVQAVQKLKLFTSDAKLWNIENKLLLAANRHLAVVPYYLPSQKIESILGSSLHFKNDNHSGDTDIQEIQETKVADWGLSKINGHSELPVQTLNSNVASEIKILLHEGVSDASIQQHIIPKLIENNDYESILWCLDNLTDLNEELIVQLLRFCLEKSQRFSKNESSDNPIANKLDNQQDLLNKILKSHYTEISLISQIRTRLDFNQILVLLAYLVEQLEDMFILNNGVFNIDYDTSNCIFMWIRLLMDSHYQEYLMSQDEDILKTLEKVVGLLEKHVQVIQSLVGLRAIFTRIKNGKLLKSIPNDINKFYSIEEVKLY